MPTTPVIPEFITVHLGAPDDNAPNVTIPFTDYVKNVASSEIYPTWPENALRANIYAITTFALNRIYSEYYRSRGYNFDITNSTRYDQAYVHGRNVFEDISRIVDETFNDYVRRPGTIEPYFTQFCNGTTVTCDGLSQWGTVTLANQGYTPYEILTYYYGPDLEIVRDAPVQSIPESYPGTAMRIGDASDDIKLIQIRLNRISQNYPAIPKITNPDGLFDAETYNAVRAFQQIFNLEPDGIVGKATWYKILSIFNGVKRIAELDSEGIRLEDVSKQFGGLLRPGDSGTAIQALQYYLRVVGDFNAQIPAPRITGVFDEQTENAVRSFQQAYGLAVDGLVGENTWNTLYDVYAGIAETVPREYWGFNAAIYPGYVLRLGMSGPSVSTLQTYLAFISQTFPQIPQVSVTGNFDEETQDAVLAFQREFGFDPTGLVGPITWNAIAETYSTLYNGAQRSPGQFPGQVPSQSE